MTASPSDLVLVFGAGATKACGGPMTNEILPKAFRSHAQAPFTRKDHLAMLTEFLTERFNLPEASVRQDRHFPALPLLMSLVDTAIDRKQPFGSKWEIERLGQVRAALEYKIFALLQRELEKIGGGETLYYSLFKRIADKTQAPPQMISLNYDIVADSELYLLSREKLPERYAFPDYGCDIQTPRYLQNAELRYGTILKLHGSLHWMCCSLCNRLDIGYSGRSSRFVKLNAELFEEMDELEGRYESHGIQCRDSGCEGHVRPILITPTHRKDYRNPHVARIWYEADRLLRQAKRVIFIGYSLPDDDVEVIYLFKQALAHLAGEAITVVERVPIDDQNNQVGSRYRSLFGDSLDWHSEGFEVWLKSAANQLAV